MPVVTRWTFIHQTRRKPAVGKPLERLSHITPEHPSCHGREGVITCKDIMKDTVDNFTVLSPVGHDVVRQEDFVASTLMELERINRDIRFF